MHRTLHSGSWDEAGRGLCVLNTRKSERPSGSLHVVRRGCLPRPWPQAPWRLCRHFLEGKKDNLPSWCSLEPHPAQSQSQSYMTSQMIVGEADKFNRLPGCWAPLSPPYAY